MDRAAADFRLLVATGRPAVRAFFETLGFLVGVVAVSAEAAEQQDEQFARATALVVDCAIDPHAASELCRHVHAERPELPLVALLCCPHSVTPWDLRALLEAGVSGLLDLRGRAEDARRALESVARGETVMQLQLARGARSLLADAFMGGRRSRNELTLLELVARGMSDREIGGRLFLSPHTVKHRIDQLRRDIGVRNRTELAAWAGRHGFYAEPRPHARAGRAAPTAPVGSRGGRSAS